MPGERLRLLETTASGLREDDARLRLRQYGPNEPVRARRRNLVFMFGANFTHMLAVLLWFAAGLAFAASIPELGAAIVAVIAVNGVFAFVQEYRAEQVVGALMRRVAVRARVLRDGRPRLEPARALVPGDVVLLAAGDIVPADCVLIESENLALDLSMLTGETQPAERSAAVVKMPVAGAIPHISDVACAAPGGAGVVTGTGTALVFATGPRSSIGLIAALTEEVERAPSVLEAQVATLSHVTAVLAVLAGTLTLVLAAISIEVDFIVALTFATGVIVALVPEGLLPTLSVSLAIGAERMAERGAAVRRLSSIEAIGQVTVICTDKTGTLTMNALSFRGFTAPDGGETPSDDALLAAALCNDARRDGAVYQGDPLDVALAAWASECGWDVISVRERHERVAAVAFDARRRYMAVTCAVDGRPREFIKGAPEAVLELPGADRNAALLRDSIAGAVERGERVVLLAERRDGAVRALGLVCLHDPPRPEVPAAIQACREARIRVVMLTGDHPGTARALARGVGLGTADTPVMEGAALDAMSDTDLLAALSGDAIFARIDPRQKLRITMLLRRAGEIVVVTGDGVNDAPALRAANVGVAMGRRGTEVAKQAADVVLSDDNFATIVAAIEEGRTIKENIRRFVSYVFTSNVAELAPFLLYIFLPVPLPLAIAQVLAIDLGTDLLPAMALGTEPPSPRTMQLPPESAKRPLLTRALATRTFLFFGVIEAALGIVCFMAVFVAEGWRPFDSLGPFDALTHEARSLTFLGIVAGQVGCLFAQRDGPLLRRLSLLSNRWIAAGLAFELTIALALVYVPGLNRIFSMEAVSPAWLLAIPGGATVFLLLDVLRRSVAGRRL